MSLSFAREFAEILQSKDLAGFQELFSSRAVAIPLVTLASILLFRAPLGDILEGTSLYE